MKDEQLNKFNNLFEKAKNEDSRYSFEDTKQQFLSSVNRSESLKGSKYQGFSYKLWIMISTIIGVALIAWLTPTESNIKTKDVKEQIVLEQKILTDSAIIQLEQNQVIQAFINDKKHSNQIIIEKEEVIIPEKTPLSFQLPIIEIPQDSILIAEQKTSTIFKDEYRFPKLNEEEIKANNKQKRKMLKALAKISSKTYSYIPSNSYNFSGEIVSIQAFYIGKYEVSNLEYRTFLFDLLIQNKKEEFLLARPDQKMWTKEYPESHNEPMEKLYFSHEAYNEYPVVGISRKGAEIYCNWLTSETNKIYGPKTGSYKNDVRIPQVYEWMAAARSESKNIIYPWEGNDAKNSKGCYLANYNPEEDNPKADGAFHPAKVSSYLPNGSGLHCMSGNVAEMVYYEDGRTKPGTKGGSWNSTLEELQIEGSDPYKGQTSPSVNVGFRVVITYLHPRIENAR